MWINPNTYIIGIHFKKQFDSCDKGENRISQKPLTLKIQLTELRIPYQVSNIAKSELYTSLLHM